MPKTVKIAGININANFFNSYMKNIFGESFAHSSLSFEKVFKEGDKYSRLLAQFISKENTIYAEKLRNGTPEEKQLLEQRLNEVKMVLIRKGVPIERIEINENEYSPCLDDFQNFLIGAVRPYRTKAEYLSAQEKGLTTGEKYESETLLDKAIDLFEMFSEKIKADKNAFELKKGNNEAFAYALSLDKIGIPEILQINAKVNNESGIHTGFKSTDNQIIGAPFSPCPKELVPYEMQQLLHKYNNEWAQQIPEFIEGISTKEEKDKYLRAICEREAKFHIEFERIHPFEDGNGRTGRIILNANLVKNGMAPIIITTEMRDEYISSIDYYNYQQLGQQILAISSINQSLLIAAYRRAQGKDPNELRINQPANHQRRILEPEITSFYQFPAGEDSRIFHRKK
jgi:prophage maintenance system killer protein